MDDLVPFLIFIVVVIINLVKFVAEKGGKKKRAATPSGSAPPKRKPTTIETFFEELAGKLEPRPAEPAGWPEGRERPDYMKEMEEFEPVQAETYEEERAAEIIPMPSPGFAEPEITIPVVQMSVQTSSLKTAMKSMPSGVASLKSMTIASAPILRSSSAGRINFPLKEKSALRKAIIANLIFSPPRAYDASFDTTIAK